MKVALNVIGGPHAGKSFEFDEHDTFIVGRGHHARFKLSQDDKFFSRSHFLIEVNPPLCRLVDLNSSNGTYVNEKRVTTVDLSDGDKIRGGDTVIAVSIDVPKPDEPLGAMELKPDLPTEVLLAPPRPNAPPPTHTNQSTHTRPDRASSDTLPQFPGYRVNRMLGRGGMGVVYEGDSLPGGTRVAIKVIRPNVTASGQDLMRFVREASILRDLVHPNVVSYRDFCQYDSNVFIVMDYVDGANAENLVADSGNYLPLERSVGIIVQLLTALDYAHSRKYVHRDVKPSNLLVATNNDIDHVFLADFGLARIYQSSKLSGLTITGDIGGTTPFMPPEQITDYRKVTPAADQYSAAATLYFLLTKSYIYDFPDGVVTAKLKMVLESDPLRLESRRRDLPPKLVEAIHKALSRDPSARYTDVSAFKQALRSAIA